MTAPTLEEAARRVAPPPAHHRQGRGRRRGARRIAVFITLVLLILAFANAFVSATLCWFFNVDAWYRWQLIPDLLAVAFVGASALGFRYANPVIRLVYSVSAAWLGVLNFAFFASVACWVVAGVAKIAGWHVAWASVATVLYSVGLLFTVYGLINAAWVRVTRVTVPLPNLPDAWAGRTIALVTDLHLGHVNGPYFLKRVVNRLRALQPDAVMISGDMFDGTPVHADYLVANWKGFSVPRGVYYVTGNHDEFANRSIFVEAVKRTGIRVLENEKVVVDGLQVVGIFDSEATNPNALRTILLEAQLDPRCPSILLAHQPANLAIAEEAGVSLQLSGHTHHGQMWPWNMLVRRIYGPFAYGLHRLGRMLVYTSSGAGTWGPPLRVGTRSEIVLLKLTRAS